jgi:hypothetical protein
MNFASLFPMITLAMACSLMADDGWRLDDAAVQAAADRLDEAMIERAKPGDDLVVPPLVNDATFLRRACVDLAGRLPTAEEVEAFGSDGAADKRARWVDRLLLEQGAADLRFQRMADTLRVKDEVLGASQKPYIDWLKDAIRRNMPLDELIRRLLVAKGSLTTNPATGFLLRDAGDLLVTTDEMTRGLLGEDIHCAACHDHAFADWTQMQFYQFAACFAGVRVARVPSGGSSSRMTAFEAAAPKTLLPGARPVGKRKARSEVALEIEVGAGELWPNSSKTTQPFRDLDGNEFLVLSENHLATGVLLPADYKYRDGKPGQLVRPQFLFFNAQQRAQDKWMSIQRAGMSRQEKLATWVTAPRNPRFAMVGAARVWTWLFGPVSTEVQGNWREDANMEVVLPLKMRGMDCREAPGSWGRLGDFEKAESDPLFVALRDEFIACRFDLREMTRIVARTLAYQREAMDVNVYRPNERMAPLVRRIPAEVVWDTWVEWQPDDAPLEAKVMSIDMSQVPAADHALRILGRGSREWTDESMPLISFSITRLISGGESVSRAAKNLGGPDGWLTDSEAITRRLFRAVLSRDPQASELAVADRHLAAGGSGADIAWALINTSEFLFNH